MSERGGLVVVIAHPDDEVLIAGGTLAACGAAGLPTGVVCLTRGEGGPISDPALASRENLAQVRLHELEASCAELGVGWLKCYRRQDGNLRWADGNTIVGQLEQLLLARPPDAVITFGEEGLYYHPDHIATYDYTRRAVGRLADPPLLYRSIWPCGLMDDLIAELRRRRMPCDLWGMEADLFGVEDSDRVGEIALDVSQFARRKLRALRCHRTQLGQEHAFTALSDDLAERFLGIERFAPVWPKRDAAPPSAGDGDWLRRAVSEAMTRA